MGEKICTQLLFSVIIMVIRSFTQRKYLDAFPHCHDLAMENYSNNSKPQTIIKSAKGDFYITTIPFWIPSGVGDPAAFKDLVLTFQLEEDVVQTQTVCRETLEIFGRLQRKAIETEGRCTCSR